MTIMAQAVGSENVIAILLNSTSNRGHYVSVPVRENNKARYFNKQLVRISLIDTTKSVDSHSKPDEPIGSTPSPEACVAIKRHLFLLAIALTLAPLKAMSGPISLFPNADVLLNQADEGYDEFFTVTDWKLKTVEINGVVRQARYQSSVMLFPPLLTRNGIYSWTVLYRVKDRYKAAGQSLYACRIATIAVKYRLSSGEWKWIKDVRLENAFDRTDDPCGANSLRVLQPTAGPSIIPDAIKGFLP
jgi:hypothetical protein